MYTQKKNAQLAILHDYIEHTDGGSRLCTILGRQLDADLYYGFRRAEHPFFTPPYGPGAEQALMHAINIPLLRQFLLTRTFSTRTQFIRKYPTTIFSGFYAPLAAPHLEGQQGIYYCHTPPRFVYGERDFFLSTVPAVARPLLNSFINWYAPQFKNTLPYIQTIVANSKNVQERIKKFLHRDSTIVYPPCDTEQYHNAESQGYYLSMGRLDPLKRIDVIINAFKKMPTKKLVITSSGPSEEQLKKLAADCDNIKFMGQLSEKQLQKAIAESIATIYIPKQEDFGMCAIESMAAGKPVIVAAEGGLLETVTDGDTGIFTPEDPHDKDIIEAVNSLSANKATSMKTACFDRAAQFDTSVFVNAMKRLIWEH